MVGFSSNTVVTVTDDLTSGNDEGVATLSLCCQDNSPMPNASKTKELSVDFRRHQRTYTAVGINGTAVERVSIFRDLGVLITEDLSIHPSHEPSIQPMIHPALSIQLLKKYIQPIQ